MKAKVRKARETRAAYRVRTKHIPAKPVRLKRARKPGAPVVRWEERVAPTDEQLSVWSVWLDQHETEFEEKYPGHYLAVWDKQIIAMASSRKRLYTLADQARPNVIPLVTYIPRVEDVTVVPSNFPIDWVQTTNAKRTK